MKHRRPPVLGALLQVIPAVQIQRRAPWTVTLVSAERRDTVGVASFDLVRDGPVDHSTRMHPWLVVDAADDRGRRYASSFGGGYGGGTRDEGDSHRRVITFTPPFDESAAELRVCARLQLIQQEGGFPPRQVVAWEDPEPWVFPVALTGSTRHPTSGDGEPPTDGRRQSDPKSPFPPELRRLLDVVPVAQTREDAGWSITCIAVERYDDGFRIAYRLRGAGKGPANPELRPRVSDDLGNDDAAWDGGGNGEGEMGACHWRISTNHAPAIDHRSRELRIEIAEVQTTTVERDEEYPGRGRIVVSGTDQGDWRFSVPLR